MIAWLNCLVINENLSSSVNVFANFASMFATWFVAFRFIISNSIPDEGREVVWKCILEVEQRYLQSFHHLINEKF